MMLPKIYDYEMPHLLDRTGQQEAFEAVAKWYTESPAQYMVLSAPTGLGKTAILAQMSRHTRIMALARTKALLDSVYSDYEFQQLQGKGNHPCHVSPYTHRADVCALPDRLNSDERYKRCSGSGKCSYYVQLQKFCESHKSVTTYAKFVSDRQDYNNPTLYAFDEAHEIPEAVIERAGINIDTSDLRKHPYLKDFPGLINNENMSYDDGIEIMRCLYSTAARNPPKQKKLLSEMTSKEEIQFKRDVMRYKQFLKRIEETGKMMVLSHESDDAGGSIWHYSSSERGDFSARPMSAEYHFKKVLGTDKKTILMSATITPFIAEQLGIDPEDFEFYEAPQQYPVHMRQIWDLGLPSMGKAATDKNPALRVMQAQKISQILKLRPDVSSVILTTSKVKANLLATMLRQFGHDVFTPPIGFGTDKQLKSWEDYRKPGSTCISYNFWEGVSLDDDDMLFIAGLKYPDLGSPFERARADRSWEIFYYRGAIHVVQGSGRIQRGHLRDYLPIGGPGNMVGKMVFLAVGGYKRITKLAPGDFKERIRPWEW